MVLECPNYFDEFERIRTPSQPYNWETNYSTIIRQLKTACREFNYLAIAPQNLVAPAELLSVVVIKDRGRLCTFRGPNLFCFKGERWQKDACANVFLVRGGKKVHPTILLKRPVDVQLYWRRPNGHSMIRLFRDSIPRDSMEQSPVGAICHELEHLQGRLIVDHARERLLTLIGKLELVHLEPGFKKEMAPKLESLMPQVLAREGDKYILRHGSEFTRETVPPVSPDTMFLDYFCKEFNEVNETFVPRGGELLPIKPSETVLKLAAR